MDNDNAVTLLRATKERLFDKGWMKGDAGTSYGPNCLLGAIEYTAISSSHSGWSVALNALGQVLGQIDRFNDLPETTFDDIVDAIDRSIKSLEG